MRKSWTLQGGTTSHNVSLQETEDQKTPRTMSRAGNGRGGSNEPPAKPGATRSQKRQGGPLLEHGPKDGRLDFRRLVAELRENRFLFLEATKFSVICSNSPRELIKHLPASFPEESPQLSSDC